MQKKLVFQDIKEMNRLTVQNRLLYPCEEPVLKDIFSEKQDISVLDIGCNRGDKTFELFSGDKVFAVVGADVSRELAQKAQKKYGDDRFSFHQWDVESDGFCGELSEFMKERGTDGFDIIYLSFVLMHLEDIKGALCRLKPFLKEDGRLMIVEADDKASYLTGDIEGLLDSFLDMLDRDRYSGNRRTGYIIDDILSRCGYDDIHIWNEHICAGKGEKKKKKDIFTTFFSYLPEDIKLLRREEPHNTEYMGLESWIDKNYKRLFRHIMADETEISMGIKIITCRKGNCHGEHNT